MTRPTTNNSAAETFIPQYSLYGNRANGKERWFVSVEPLSKRCSERGWVIEPHAHPNFGQILIALNGKGSSTFEDRTVRFKSPCALVIPPHCIHGFSYEKDTDGWVITIEQAYLDQINKRLPEFGMLWLRPSAVLLPRDNDFLADIGNVIEKLVKELDSRSIGHVIATEALLTSLSLKLLRSNIAMEDAQSGVRASQLKLVRNFQMLIEENYQKRLQLADFCGQLGVSISQLRYACESVCNQVPIKMIHERKLTEAKRNLIFSDMSIEQIAYWLGFSSPAYFSRFFKSAVGQSPVEFRRLLRVP
jgi:AraC family transcriptional regulator, transcriptional activator of pobA